MNTYQMEPFKVIDRQGNEFIVEYEDKTINRIYCRDKKEKHELNSGFISGLPIVLSKDIPRDMVDPTGKLYFEVKFDSMCMGKAFYLFNKMEDGRVIAEMKDWQKDLKRNEIYEYHCWVVINKRQYEEISGILYNYLRDHILSTNDVQFQMTKWPF